LIVGIQIVASLINTLWPMFQRERSFKDSFSEIIFSKNKIAIKKQKAMTQFKRQIWCEIRSQCTIAECGIYVNT